MTELKIGAVLMASGFGRRFGGNKLLAQYRGKALFRWAFDACPAALFDAAAAVSGYPEILKAAEGLGYQAVFNSAPQQGQSASVRLGLEALGEVDAALFAVCDQPRLTRESVERLLSAHRAAPEHITALGWGGRKGNPVIFPSSCFEGLLALTGDVGGGGVVKARPELLRVVDAGAPEELLDVDRAEDLGT